MMRILRDKFRSLLYGDDGAALVITLAVFFLLYLLCMGSLAVGTAVKERIQLQNACDAAVYSAAVVQADTLSRIATLNRAMSWTYAQMSRRQMDYIVSQWLKRTIGKYNDNLNTAKRLGNPGRHGHEYWQWIDPLRTLTLNRHIPSTLGAVDATRAHFLSTHLTDNSFYSAPGDLARQIIDDKGTIRLMNRAIHNEQGTGLMDRLSRRVNSVVAAVVGASGLSESLPVQHKVFPEDYYSHFIRSIDYLRPLRTDEEGRFLAFSGRYDDIWPFENGSGQGEWFPRVDGKVGFQRDYRQLDNRLRADWTWWYRRWVCPPRSACVPVPSFNQNTCFAEEARDSLFTGETAYPFVLNPSYFGKDGTITIGLARRNRNPLAALWGDGDTILWSGVLSAFNPFCQDTVVFSSAKAGYKRLGEEYDDAGNLTREYRIDWDDNQDWNLCQSDWDAVFVPVRMAQTMAKDGGWGASKNDFLGEWVQNLIGSSESLRSGGTKRYNPTRDDPLDYRHSRGWGRRPDYAKGLVVTEWQIEDKNKKPDWDRMTERMFH